MAAAKKPTAQQKEQAKARAGGNNPIKVTNKGLKKLGKVALVAASVAPVGRGVKVATTVVKAAKTAKAANAAKQVALKAGQTKTLADKAKLEKLASAIKDYEKRISSNKDAIKKLDLGPKQRPDASKQFRDMTQGIKDTEKALKEAKIQYMNLKNPWK